jgi:hypothetical protein
VNRLNSIKPAVSSRTLLLIAAIVWTAAGGLLAGRGMLYLMQQGHHLVIRMLAAILFGGLFFVLLFARISARHIRRIRGLNIPYPCAFSFFNVRSYLIMVLMIGGSILLRQLDVIEKEHLNTFFVTMGIPLLISAGRFYYAWATDAPA